MSQTNEGLSKSRGVMHIYSPECECGLCQGETKAKAAAALEAAKDADPLNDELQAMRSVARTLEKLPRDAQERVITWLCNRLPPRLGFGYGDMAAKMETTGPRR